MVKPCKDCVTEGVTGKRVMAVDKQGNLQPGPRCVTHHRMQKTKRSKTTHERMLEAVYGITGDEYEALFEAQGRCCFVCQRAKGIRRRLAVDHLHDAPCVSEHTGTRQVACRKCVRGLLCKTCNYVVLGRYSPEALHRAINYMHFPPAQQVLLRGTL